jgi:hypothetical protein
VAGPQKSGSLQLANKSSNIRFVLKICLLAGLMFENRAQANIQADFNMLVLYPRLS